MFIPTSINNVYRSLEGSGLKNNILFRLVVPNPGNWSRIVSEDLNSFVTLNPTGNPALNDTWEFMRGTFLLHDQEPLLYSSQKHIWDKFKFTRSMYDDRMMVLHSELNSPELDKFCKDYNAIPVYWFSNGALAYEWYAPYRFNLFPAKEFTVMPLKYKFVSLNRLIGQQRIYRPILSSMLESTINHNELRLSCNLVDPYSRKHALDCIEGRKIPDSHMKLLERFAGRNDTIMINNPDSMQESQDRDKDGNALSAKILIMHFTFTFCHIATETMFYDDTIHLTEKSFRAFINMRPMILVGPAGSLAYLRNYGFKTFGDYWDESYDDIRDPNERLDKIFNLIKELNKMSLADMTIMLRKMMDILEFNRNHFFNEFPNIIMRELSDNVEKAINLYSLRTPNGWLLERLSQLTKQEFSDIKNVKDIPNNNITSLEIYEDLRNGSRSKQDAGLIRFLHQHLDLSDVNSSAEALNKIQQILA